MQWGSILRGYGVSGGPPSQLKQQLLAQGREPGAAAGTDKQAGNGDAIKLVHVPQLQRLLVLFKGVDLVEH